MIKKIFLLSIFVLFTNKIYAQDIIKALSDAYKNNPKLNAERAKLDSSKQDVNISKGNFLPSITLSGDIATQEDTNRINKSGTSLADTSSTPESQSLLIEQKIFDGFTNYNDLKKSKLKLEYSKIELNKLEQEVILNAAIAYYGLAYNFKNFEFNESNTELLERQVETDRSRLDRGEISLTDLAQSESSLAGAQAKLITSKNELVSSKKNFQKIVGTIPTEKVNLDFFPYVRTPNTLQLAISIAKDSNPNLKLAEIDLEIAKKELSITKGDLAPSAKLSYSLKKNQDLSTTVDEREQEEVKATVTWPIFDGGKNISSVRKSKFKVKQKQLILEDVQNQIQIETANAWTTYESSKGVLEATSAQLKAAEIANEGITLEYDTGNQRTTLEVIQSRALLLEARTGYAKAQKDFAIAQFNLLASIGNLYLKNIK